MRFPLRATPYVRLAKRLFFGPGSLEGVSYQQDVLCPEETVAIPPAIFLPGQIEKVTKQKRDTWGHKTKEQAIAEATSTTATHAPTIAYHIKDAILFDGQIYAGRFKYPIADKSLYAWGPGKEQHIKAASLASSYLGTKYFGHWLADDCTRYMLAEQFARPLCVRMPPYAHRLQYQTYFGQDWTPIDRARIAHLVVFQDFSQNSFKRERYRILRSRIKARFPKYDQSAYVYLRRGQTGVRRPIQNEQEIVETLSKRGFMIVDIASDTLEQIIGILLNAKIVVSLEGSHVTHCTLTVPENSNLLILEPPDRFSGVHRSQAGSLGIRFGFVVGQEDNDGYHFPVTDILRTVDLLLSQIESRNH